MMLIGFLEVLVKYRVMGVKFGKKDKLKSVVQVLRLLATAVEHSCEAGEATSRGCGTAKCSSNFVKFWKIISFNL